MVDEGWNKQFAALGDAINPFYYERELVLSVNPIDFWYMSIMYDSASCHTIDKENTRNMSNAYSGQYSSGCTSYLTDSSSFVVYERPTEEELARKWEDEVDFPMEMQSKFRRCMFYIGEDKLVQSRVYPDGRDGGDASIASQWRAIVQKTIADLLDTPNLWTIKHGINNVMEITETATGATHYTDYNCCKEVNVSYLKRVNGDKNIKRITIGHKPICVVCGEEHTYNENIMCPSCCPDDGYTCERCGCYISEDSDEMIHVDGHIYCDAECAERDGYVFCDGDDYEWHYEDDCRQDDYNERWYYNWESTDNIETDDDTWYADWQHAERDGYSYAEREGVWTDSDNVYCNDGRGTFVETGYPIEVNGNYYPDDDEGEEWLVEDGYEWNDELGEWVAA
jgi:hypothetical protein